MFGVLRTTLALMVMFYHLFLGVLPLGTYAVYGFYIISGFLMTSIMHETYGYSAIGRVSFGVNRFLRLYPQYWAAGLLSLFLIYFLGEKNVISFHKAIFYPVSLDDFLKNFFMVFAAWYPNSITPRLVPPAWALTVELFFYCLICLGASKTLLRVKVWFIFSVLYVIYSYAMGWSWHDRYFPVLAAALPFSIGSALYFCTKKSGKKSKVVDFLPSAPKLFILMLVNCIFWMALTKAKIGLFVEVGFYLNILICALLVYRIACGGEALPVGKKMDRFIGDFSYPIYLLHWQVGLLVPFLIYGVSFHEYSLRSSVGIIGPVFFVVVFSLAFIWFIDRPIERLRTIVKAKISAAKESKVAAL